jgi:hypothetical protein
LIETKVESQANTAQIELKTKKEEKSEVATIDDKKRLEMQGDI